MELHFVGMANVFVFYPYLKKARSAAAHCVRGSVVLELPSHLDTVALEKLIRDCWAKVEWGYGRILVRDGANAGWINYVLKDRQKSEFDGFLTA